MQINRLFGIIYILLQTKTVTATLLAEKFEVSKRTIYRDIETLSAAEIPIYMTKGRGGGISLMPDYVLNKTVLTQNEKSQILSSLFAIKSVSFAKNDNTILKKLIYFLGETCTQNNNWIEVDFSSWANSKKEQETFDTVKAAIIKKNVITFSYVSGNMQKTIREVEPLKLCFKGQAWYLYAFCRIRCDYRFFKLRRIENISDKNEIFLRVADEVVLKNEDKVIQEEIEITLKISKEMAFRVYDECELFSVTENGDFIVKLKFPKNEWLYSYIVSFGKYCEVIKPVDIRDEIKSNLNKTLENYN